MLRNTAYLEVFHPLPDGSTRQLTFEFSDGFELDRSLDWDYFLGPRGQFAREAYDQLRGQEPTELSNRQRRTGYHIDSGMGAWMRTASFTTGAEDEAIQWGDGSSDPNDPDDITVYDASGASVNKEDRADIFERNVATAITDSSNPGRLHYNQWSDGTYGEAGVFERPMPVAIYEANCSSDTSDPSAVEGNITMAHTATLPESELWDFVGLLDGVFDFG